MEIVIGVVVLIALVGVLLLALRKKPSLPKQEEQAAELPPKEEATGDAVEAAQPASDEVEANDDDDRKTPIVSDPAMVPRDDDAHTAPVPETPRSKEPQTKEVKQAVETPEPPSQAVSTIDAHPSDIEALRTGLATTRGGFIRKLRSLFERPTIDESLLEDMEDVLLTSDIGVQTAEQILGALKGQVARGELKSSDQIWAALRAEALSILKDPAPKTTTATEGPRVLLFVGVNGVGKTTTIGKLASKYKADGQKILLAAGDTYRAAASLQLEAWGRRVGCETVKGKDKSDPASVIFSAVERAKEEGFDVVLADTAGRLHTKTNLMEELKKVGRAAEKALGRPVDEIFLVLDATNGQNAIQQVELFGDALDLTGIVLTKLDGTAKGGVILGIRQKRPIPVRYIGVGEKVDDLREFSAESFVEALFSEA